MFGRALQTVTRRVAQSGVRTNYGGRTSPLPSYNDLPVPQGCWREAYERDQKKFNAILLGGVVTLLGTIAIGKLNGWLYFNYAPPKAD